MSRKPKNALMADMDAFAVELLSQAKTVDKLEDKISAFKEIGRWVLIKHRLDPDQEGEGIDALKSRLHQGDTPGRKAGPTFGHGIDASAATARRFNRPEGDGSGIDALRARLPSAAPPGLPAGHDGRDHGGVHGAGADPGGPIPIGTFARRSRLLSVPGGAEPERDDAVGGGNV